MIKTGFTALEVASFATEYHKDVYGEEATKIMKALNFSEAKQVEQFQKYRDLVKRAAYVQMYSDKAIEKLNKGNND